MPKTTVAGHPLHPQLIPAPAALLPFSLVMDLMHLGTGEETYAHVAHHSMVGGVVGGLAAATAGVLDYLEIPNGTHVKKTANLHGALNAGAMALYGVNLLLRSRRRVPSGVLPTVLSAIGTATLTASAWYGGHMVYEQGVRVKGRDPLGDAPEVKPPADAAVEGAFSRAEEMAPSGGAGS